MKLSKRGADMIKNYEKLRLTAYKARKSEKFWTIGWGHYGADVVQGAVITRAKADELFDKDVKKFEFAVDKLHLDLNQNQYDALVSFAYNCGAANLERLVSGRNKQQIADAMLLYNKSNGEVLSGLTRRRKEERALFLQDNTIDAIAKEVIEGKWGNGRDRKERLRAAGYDYAKVQSRVNAILTGEK